MSDKNLVYPDWVQQYRTRGKTVKKKGDNYYLYSRTSKRVPGKKHPQPVDTYIGVITPDGVINAKSKIVQVDVCDVYEFGFSKVLQVICPDEWKLAVGKDWEKILQILIQKESVNTYLVHDVEIPDPNGFDVSWGVPICDVTPQNQEDLQRRQTGSGKAEIHLRCLSWKGYILLKDFTGTAGCFRQASDQ